MRLRYNKNYLKLFILFILLSASLMMASLSRNTTVDAAICPTPVNGDLNPAGNIRVSVVVPAGSEGTLPIPIELFTVEQPTSGPNGTITNHTIDTSIGSEDTCPPTNGAGSAHLTAIATFIAMEQTGDFKACYKGVCSNLLTRPNNSTNDTIFLSLSANDLSGAKKEVSAVLRIDIPLSNESVTYGPRPIDLKDSKGDVIESASTTKKTYSNGSIAKTIDLVATFKDVPAGDDYTVCVQRTDKCSDKFKKVDSAKKTAIIRAGDVGGLPDPGSASNDNDNSCGSQVTGLGWIMCPIINGLTKLNDAMWNLVSGLLTVNPLRQSDNIYKAWGSIRSIANVVFVIFFLIIIFSQLTGAGITNYGVKKMLPKIIIAAILVNVSFIIVQLAVDLANVIGSSLYGLIVGMAPPITGSWDMLVQMLEQTGAFATGAVIGVTMVGGPMAAFWLLLPIALIGTLGILTAVLTLIFRQAVIPVLAILAPLAFVAYLLPNTEPWFKKWRSLLMSMLMLYPMAALVFAGAYFAAAVIISGGGFWNLLIGQIILAVPLFSLPFLARQGGAILGKVSGTLGGMLNNARKPIGTWAGKNAERAQTSGDLKAFNDKSKRPNFRRYLLKRRAKYTFADQNQKTELNRAQTEYVAREVENDEAFRARVSQGGSAGADMRSLAGAKNIQAKLKIEEVTAAKAVIKDLDQDSLRKLSQGGSAGGLNAKESLALKTAAMQMTIDSQDIEGTNSLLNIAAKPTGSPGGMDLETRRSFADSLLASSGKPSYVGAGAIAGIRAEDNPAVARLNSTDLAIDAINKNVYSQDKLANASKDELTHIFNVAQGRAVPPITAVGVQTAQIKQNANDALANPLYSGRISKQITEVTNIRDL